MRSQISLTTMITGIVVAVVVIVSIGWYFLNRPEARPASSGTPGQLKVMTGTPVKPDLAGRGAPPPMRAAGEPL